MNKKYNDPWNGTVKKVVDARPTSKRFCALEPEGTLILQSTSLIASEGLKHSYLLGARGEIVGGGHCPQTFKNKN